MTVIAIRDGAVELRGRPVLRGIDLTVDTGEVVAVLGANGSGKSTLVRTMMGLVPTVRGSVELFGTPVRRFRQWHRIGFVPQRTTAAAGVPATVYEVVSSGRLSERRLAAPMRKVDRAAIRDAIAAVELSDRTQDSVSTLSGGQQQRVLIARALASRPELLVLDEPTAGVDLLSQQTFAEVLRTHLGRGTTVILVAHEMGPIEPLVSRTVVMRDGRVAYDGEPLKSFHEAHHHHGHHHPDLEHPVDYTPGVVTGLDQRRGE